MSNGDSVFVIATDGFDGVSYSDYVEQLTYLLFLKVAEEIVENLEAGLGSFKEIVNSLNGNSKK